MKNMDTKNENLLASRVGGNENKTFSEISMESQNILLKELVEEAKIMKKKNEREGAVVFIPNPIMYQLEMLKYIQEGEKLPKKHIIAAILKLFLMKTAEAVSQKSKKLTLGENITEGDNE